LIHGGRQSIQLSATPTSFRHEPHDTATPSSANQNKLNEPKLATPI
jgi:hypothetical protein